MAIPFVRDMEFEYGVVQQVSPLIRRVVANNPSPFTFRGTGVYIIGKGDLAVIDPGPDDPAHIEALMNAVTGERVTHIFVTHLHLDHCPAARPLAKLTGATIYASGAPMAAEEEGPQMEEGGDHSFHPDVELKDGDLFAGPGWTIEALFTPGHTSNHVCFALTEENALFSGDHIMGWSTTVVSPPDGDMQDYMQSLDKVLARNFETLWPTHGPPIREPRRFIQEYAEHRLNRERQILDQLRAGRTRIKDMVPVMYAEVDARLHPAASRSVLAHMIRLVQIGAVRAEGPPGPDARYAIA